MNRLLISAMLAIGLHVFLLLTSIPWGHVNRPVSVPIPLQLELVSTSIVSKSFSTLKMNKNLREPPPQLSPLAVPRVLQSKKHKPVKIDPVKSVKKVPAKIVKPEHLKHQLTPLDAKIPLLAKFNPTSSATDKKRSEPFLPESPIAKTGEGNNKTVPRFVSAAPRYRENPPPIYPRRAKRKNMEGTVRLTVWVNHVGIVTEVHLSQSSGYSLLDRIAIQAVEKWKFDPAMRDGQTVASRVEVPIVFELR